MGSRRTFQRDNIRNFSGNASKSCGHFLETLKYPGDFSWKSGSDAFDFVDASYIGCKCIFGRSEKLGKARKRQEKLGKAGKWVFPVFGKNRPAIATSPTIHLRQTPSTKKRLLLIASSRIASQEWLHRVLPFRAVQSRSSE
jgi:hypothetical protein